ncbi:MAG: sigma-70 family RNA polymerase sigma factor [Eubacteriales bacterium]|nr:sigma-70 family RNA polymerase sigma factor [Eubacteriales bacterium]
MKERDRELILRYRAGDKDALEVLLALYKPLILACSKKYYVPGLASEDLLQEAMIALYRAVENYDTEAGPAFAAFAERVVNNRLIDRVRQAQRQSDQAFREAISLESPWSEHSDLSPEKTLAGGEDPEELVIQAEALRSLLDFFEAELSAYEAKVAAAKIDGKTYREIALKLGANEKSIDGALQRVRRKLRERLKQADAESKIK